WVEGFAARKQAIIAAIDAGGAQSYGYYFLASAMMETNNLQTDYTYGDGKTGDAFNAGLCKQNWGMIKRCHAEWSGSGDYNTAGAMNEDLSLDVQVYNECRASFGDNWWAGHRRGVQCGDNPSGGNCNPTDVATFKAAMDWTNAV